ncbi:MAG TPA: tRNA threonylcarbamoyladenosine dehydratase [Candidatus Rifleibacterium sp.]|nr:tRNA threonylcarbamoyladenosine dehydratase [Candidatus Rifleibacterium sp.]HPT46269.1 tRNA threonylcarbamoyladenosine dehydratase [Candidatus Rifleibacterium sp.]
MDNRFHRTILLLGEQAYQKLKQSHVAVFGLGGVGSFAAEALARAGVGRLTIVDFDRVNTTNINRQNIALSSTVGRAKVEVMTERLAGINPECEVTALQEFYSEDNSEQLLKHDFAAVVDAIDSFNPKIRLIVDCLRWQLPLFSAMGAAGKIDPSQVRVGDISASTICPLARRVRKILRGHAIETGFQVVYSLEPPIMPFSHTIVPADQKEPGLLRGRERMIQGTISYMPAIFGLTLAGMVVQHLSGFKTARETPAGQALQKSEPEE